MKNGDDFITIIGGEWADPIADIASAWRTRLMRPGYPSHLTLRDQGSCKAIILLLAVMLESYSLKAATSDISEVEADNKFNVRRWWGQIGYVEVDNVLDVFVMRDALAHNHLYSYSATWQTNDATVYSHIAGGDSLFTSRADEGTLKHSTLSCNPDIIGPKDVIEVARIAEQALRYLRKKYSTVGDVTFSYARRGNSHNLWDCINDAANEAIRLSCNKG